MTDPSDPPQMTYYEFKITEASDLYQGAVTEEDGQKVILNASKLKECRAICVNLVEQRNNVPLDIQAHASYFLAAGRSDDIARGYLAKAVLCCKHFETQTGRAVNGHEIFNEAYQQMLMAMGAEQSDFGGAAVGFIRHTERGRSDGGLLQVRGLPAMKPTASPPAPGSRGKLQSVSPKQMKSDFWSNEDIKP